MLQHCHVMLCVGTYMLALVLGNWDIIGVHYNGNENIEFNFSPNLTKTSSNFDYL